MMKNLVPFVLFCLVTCYGNYQDEDWIDPTDMLNYDASAGRMKHKKPHHTGNTALNEYSDEQIQGICQSDQLDCKTDNNKWKQKDRTDVVSKEEANKMKEESICKKDMDTLKKEIDACRVKGVISQGSCNPVFRRFLYRILNEAELLGLPDESQPEMHYDVEMVLTKQMVAEFRRFLDNTDWNAGPLDEALGGTLVRFRHHNEEEWSWKFEDYTGTDPFSAFMISLSLLCIVMVVATELWTCVSWFTQIRRLLALCFLVSLVWNWMYLYKDAFAERQAKLAKIGNDHTCGKKMTWSENLLEWWKSSSSFQNDPCEEYFKALMINPILLVPPTKAFAVTFTNFITEPLKHIGKGIGEFFSTLLAEMPLFYQPFVLIIIGLLLLAFFYGCGTSVHHLNILRRNHDGERERLPPLISQREANDRFLEGGDVPQPIQPRQIEGHRSSTNMPEILYPENCGDGNSRRKEQQYRKQEVLEIRGHGQPIRDESSRQPQSKDDFLDQRHVCQRPGKGCMEDSPLRSQDGWEESIKDHEPFPKLSPFLQDFANGHTEIKENLTTNVRTLMNMTQSPREAKVKDSPRNEMDQQLTKEDRSKDQEGSSLVTDISSAEYVDVLNDDDIYRDPDEH